MVVRILRRNICKPVIILIVIAFLNSCARLPSYRNDMALTPTASQVQFANTGGVAKCHFVGVVMAEATSSSLERAVELAMVELRNKSVNDKNRSGNRLIHLQTHYSVFLDRVYLGVKSELYKCSSSNRVGEMVIGEVEIDDSEKYFRDIVIKHAQLQKHLNRSRAAEKLMAIRAMNGV